MKRKLFSIAAVFCLAVCVVVAAVHYDKRPYIVGTSPGGSVLTFMEEYDALRRSRRPVILDGMCISACTLIIGLVPLDRMCMTPFAQLAFHSAYLQGMLGRQHSSEGTRLIWQTYPEPIRALLRERGWDGSAGPKDNEHPNLIYIDNNTLRPIVRMCEGS